MSDTSSADRSRGASRRAFLRNAGATGALTAAALLAPGGGAHASAPATATAQPTETGWRPKRPRLTTPWTAEVSPHNALPEYPRPQLRRPRWLNLNGVWQFGAAGIGEAAPTGRDLPERILVPYPVESALSGIMRNEHRMFYRRRFVVPHAWRVGATRGERLLLHVDAVDYHATVWVNGTEVGTHAGGYDRFSLDVTGALRTGRSGAPEGEQELVVAVQDPTEDGIQPIGKQHNVPEGLFYTASSGIWQTVWLEPVPSVHIGQLDLGSTQDNTAVTVSARVANPDGHLVRVELREGGTVVGSVTGAPNTTLTIPVESPRTWSPADPFLYDVVAAMVPEHDHDAAVDRVEAYTGIRSIALGEVSGHQRFLLNGEYIFPLSTLQQGFWPDGCYTGATDEALRFDLEGAKELGFNTVRMHVKVAPDRWYYWADRLGVLVLQDMPNTGTGRQPPEPEVPVPPPSEAGRRVLLHELHRMIDTHRSHPSIIMWIPFNEGWGVFDIAAVAEQTKQWDPTRIVNAMSGVNVCECGYEGGDVLDRHNLGVPYPGPVPRPTDGRAAMIGEFGAFGIAVPGHEWSPGASEPNVDVPDLAALTDSYVTAMGQIAEFARSEGLAAANYNLFEDAEVQVNGLYTYDRRVLKPDAARVRAANDAVTRLRP
ncbi:glycoside hydrolase family 2 protein [Prauserella cavernicola]|uniref:Glycoside hydrolase family 2 n=1 Tax=Prauserella cavernicola TaxID=2800127 RepID=A0A934V6K5_9PSEU|nr:glycoside hydrolase family 2 TIM barrel-domain containing protein [Prauserella cavernicola]MBK1787632.1 glycoside hydrolase family 2 [Prauserella cavernicola]